MARTFEWDGKRYPLVSPDDMPMGEMRWMEKQLGGDIQSAGIADTITGRVLVSLKRHGIHLRLKDLDGYTMRQFKIEGDEDTDEPDEDPQTTGVEAGPVSAPSETSGGSSS